MSNSFSNALKYAAVSSMNREVSLCSSEEHQTEQFIDLSEMQIRTLSEKITCLPHSASCVLFSKFCFNLSPADTELLYETLNAKGQFRYYRKLLSEAMGVESGALISDISLRCACELALEAQELPAENKQTHGLQKTLLFKNIIRRVAIAAIIVTLAFSTLMIASASFRELVINWVIETFDEFSIFELDSGDNFGELTLQSYTPEYLPSGFKLINTVEQPSVVLYEYESSSGDHLAILISLTDTRIYVDTENAIESTLQLEGVLARCYEKEDMCWICFERDGYFFAVYGNVDLDELIRVADSVSVK